MCYAHNIKVTIDNRNSFFHNGIIPIIIYIS